MGLADELARLDDLRSRGALSEEEFQRAKARLLDGPPPPPDIPAVAAINRLRRSRSDRWLGGVCGGIATISGVESWIWRLIFADAGAVRRHRRAALHPALDLRARMSEPQGWACAQPTPRGRSNRGGPAKPDRLENDPA